MQTRIYLYLLFLILSHNFVYAAPFKVGVISPLTGTAASNGETIRNSVLLAQEQFDPNKNTEFIFEDDQMQPKHTVSATKKLIFQDNVRGLIVFGSPTALAASPVAEQHKLTMIALSIVDKVVQGKNYVFKHWVSSRVENDLILSEVKRRGYRRVAIIASTNDAMLTLRDHFTESKSVEIVYSEDIARDEVDFRSSALKVRQSNPDAVYNLLWSPQPAIFTKSLRENGFTGPIFGVHNLEDPMQIEASQGTLNGAWFVTGDDSKAIDFYNSYQQRFGSMPTAGGTNAYDAAKMFIEALKFPDVPEYIRNLKDFNGAYGIYSSSGRNDFTLKAITKSIINGKIVSN